MLIFLYRYTFYVLLKDAFGERVRVLYTATDSFFLHFFVETWQKIKTRALISETPSTLARLVMVTFLTSDVVCLIFTPGKWAI